MTLENLKSIIDEAINEFILRDSYLLEHNVHEQAISHKLACYIGKRIDGWHVDAEYNRNLQRPKSLSSCGRVRPDILIHRRGLNNDGNTKDNNLLIIEVKKSPLQQDKDADTKIIQAFINEYPYFYKYGAFIAFDGSEIKWFTRD